MDEEKFIQRVEMMLFDTCGCNNDEAVIILEKCLERVKKRKNKKLEVKRKMRDKSHTEQVERWAEYVRTHSDKEWSEQQNIVIDGQMRE